MYKIYIKEKGILMLSGFAVLTCVISSCKKFVQVGPPNYEIVSASVFNNPNTVTSALLGIYLDMVSNQDSWILAQDQGLMADELTTYSTDPTQLQYYTNSMIASNNPGDWYDGYSYIYQANALIEGLQNNGNINPAIAQQVTGEALFIRAFWLFYLTNMYGDIPLVTTTNYATNQTLSKSSQALVYIQIISDLKKAQSLLNVNYVDATDTASGMDRIRPNVSVATAFLARVYLYTQKYDSALIEANLVIGNPMYRLCATPTAAAPNSTFLANSTEAIWQLGVPSPSPSGSNTPDANNFYLASAPSTGDENSCTISPQLLNAFEPNDQRRAYWIGVDSTGTTPETYYYFPFKYQSYQQTNVTEYTMVLRLAEQYLIRAEAEAQRGDMADAAKDLDTIRARAGLGPSPTLTATSSLQQADSAILHERQVELFTEWGHRWFDLIRMDSVNVVLGSPGDVCHYKGGKWNVDWELYPIPQNDVLLDANLKQNLGY